MNTREDLQILIGKNLRRIRQQNNITVEKLGLDSGIGYSQVSRIELGKRNPTAYTLFILSNTLNVCPSEFFKPFQPTEELQHSEIEKEINEK